MAQFLWKFLLPKFHWDRKTDDLSSCRLIICYNWSYTIRFISLYVCPQSSFNPSIWFFDLQSEGPMYWGLFVSQFVWAFVTTVTQAEYYVKRNLNCNMKSMTNFKALSFSYQQVFFRDILDLSYILWNKQFMRRSVIFSPQGSCIVWVINCTRTHQCILCIWTVIGLYRGVYKVINYHITINFFKN